MNQEEVNSGILRNWSKPLQKSLTFEIESDFINILGKERFFNEYVVEKLKHLDQLELNEKTIDKLGEFRELFIKYNDLDIPKRKKLLIDTRKFLLKLTNYYDFTKNKNSLISNKGVYSLNSDVSIIKGVGKILKANLNQIGLFNIRDIMEYFPRTYLDYSKKVKIINLRPDNLYTCTGHIKKFFIYRSKTKSNLSIMSIVIYDESSSIKITKFFYGKRFRSFSFFQSQKDKFKPGLKLAVSGKVKKTEYGRTFVDPQIEILNNSDGDLYFSGKIFPIYTLNENISSINYIKLIKAILPCANVYPDVLNVQKQKLYNLISIKDSLLNIHLPRNQSLLIEAKKRLLFDELLLLQLRFIKKRSNREKACLIKNTSKSKNLLLDNYLSNIPFELTSSQINVLNEIKFDLSSTKPMSRLLQGDVGSGKTVIAIASLLYNVEQGFQGALMVPTEVLAEQHYQNLIQNLNFLDISVEILTGNTSQKKRKKLLTDLVNGQINILVGTHALFEEKVIFNSLGMVVIDEQHRFGVGQRNKLLKKGENTNLLSMTATPIPRTLALSIYGDLDVSQITELPPGRIPVKTQIIRQKELTELFTNVQKEIYSGRQAYVVLPLIEDSEKLNLNSAIETHKYLSSNVFKEFNVGLLHGKLNSEEKHKILCSFSKNEINILVSTTVIEVGIDVPNATIMLIYNSDRFGLSQLHQLRGRVGRDSNLSYCYLITDDENNFSNKRLKVLEESNDGFYIAEKDLEFRGPGQVLGFRQSGLPDFVLDNLPNNKDLIDKARQEAIMMTQDDPHLNKFPWIKQALYEESNNKFVHDFLN